MYFERTEPTGSFVEVEIVGATLVRRWGRIGASRTSDAKQRVQPFPSERDARVAFERQARGLESKGYRPGRSHPELIRAIEQAPDEEGPFLVFADWLLEQGDPRGELIVRMGRATGQEAMTWLLSHPELKPEVWDDYASLQWRLGFVRQLTFRPRCWAGDQPPLLRRLLRHPSCQFVRELVLEGATAPEYELLGTWRELLQARRPMLQTVRLLRSPTLAPLVGQLQGLVTVESLG